MRTASFTDKHFLKDLFALLHSEINQTEKFPAVLKDAAEIAAILLICAVLFTAASLWTLKFIELLVLIVKQFFFFPLVFESRETVVNLAGLPGLILLIVFSSGF